MNVSDSMRLLPYRIFQIFFGYERVIVTDLLFPVTRILVCSPFWWAILSRRLLQRERSGLGFSFKTRCHLISVWACVTLFSDQRFELSLYCILLQLSQSSGFKILFLCALLEIIRCLGIDLFASVRKHRSHRRVLLTRRAHGNSGGPVASAQKHRKASR